MFRALQVGGDDPTPDKDALSALAASLATARDGLVADRDAAAEAVKTASRALAQEETTRDQHRDQHNDSAEEIKSLESGPMSQLAALLSEVDMGTMKYH